MTTAKDPTALLDAYLVALQERADNTADPVERFHMLEKALEQLADRQATVAAWRREIIAAERAQRWTYNQIAQRFGISLARASQLAGKTSKNT